mmetsp:Transcript_87765/g.251459  ORF Transcript_87765/g.251459 Transcript_87765/m.251459 type:complete len:256 (+) Transcript_87765:52-819(+)
MVLTLLILGSGGAAVAWVATWKDYAKPWVQRQLVAAIGKKGPDFLGGSVVVVEEVDFKLGGVSSLTLKGLTIRNLEPYPAEDLMKLDDLVVTVDMKTTFKSKLKKVLVDSVCIKGCHLAYDRGVTSSNLTNLLDKMQEKDGDDNSADKATLKGTGKKEEDGGPDIVLATLSITEIWVKVGVHLMEGAASQGVPGVPVPSIDIKNFSEKFGELTLQKFIVMLVEDILKGGLGAVTGVFGMAGGMVESSTSWFSNWF